MSLAMLQEMHGKFEDILKENPDEALELGLAVYSSPSLDFLRTLKKEKAIQTDQAVRYFNGCAESRQLGAHSDKFADVLDVYSRVGITDMGRYIRLTKKGEMFLDIMDLDVDKFKEKYKLRGMLRASVPSL